MRAATVWWALALPTSLASRIHPANLTGDWSIDTTSYTGEIKQTGDTWVLTPACSSDRCSGLSWINVTGTFTADTSGTLLYTTRKGQLNMRFSVDSAANKITGSNGGTFTRAEKPCPAVPPPPVHPNWTATYQLNRSTVVYACNFSGFFDPKFLAKFAVVGLDWSNAKAQWSAARPMDDDIRLTRQMAMIKQVDPSVKVTGYRNSIQAYNWMAVVREKIDDPAYSGWFLKYKDGINGSGYAQSPCAGPKENETKCSRFWHQLLDEPDCPDGVCDCGAAPCAMYSFDHRNSSFAKWFVSEYVM